MGEFLPQHADSAPMAGAPTDTLRRGAVGWLLLASLGVSYVIAGDYAAWNFGLQYGGWGGLAVSVAFGAAMYFALLSTLVELATIVPEAGGGSAFATRAFGQWVGCLTGACIWVEYVAAAAVIAIFLQAYLKALIGIGGAPIIIGAFLVFIVIHAAGVGEALRVLLAMALLALIGLAAFAFAAAPHFDAQRLIEIPVAGSIGASGWFPHGWTGIWATLPFGSAFFLGVEGIALAAEETRDPHRNMPRGMIAALGILTLCAVGLILLGPGSVGVVRLESANDPLVEVLNDLGPSGVAHWVTTLVNICGLAGLMACLFSAIFGYSRLTFALARANYFPAWLGSTNRRLAPMPAIIVPGAIACLLALTGAAEQIFVMMVCAGTFSYVLTIPAHWAMRHTPAHGPIYRSPGGLWTSGFAWVASAAMLVACFIANPRWSVITIGVVAFLLGWYRVRQGRPANSPTP